MARGGLQVGGNYRGAWDSDTSYTAHDIVTNGGTLYSANVDHVSSASFDAGYWSAFGPGGESVTTVATAGAAQTIPTAAGVYDFTLTAPALTLTLPTPVAGKSFSLVLRQDATGSRVVTWPACKWPGAAAPTLTTTPNGVDLVSFMCVNGTDWLGFPSGYDLR